MQYQELFSQLALYKPWKIHQINKDQQHQSLTITLTCHTKRRGWFNKAQDITCPACGEMTELLTTLQYVVVRHINLGATKIYLQIPKLQFACTNSHADCPMRLYRTLDMPYSKLMEQQIRRFSNIPNGFAAAAMELGLDPDELEQIVENGWLPRDGMLPPLSNPIWQDLIVRRISLKTKNLGLQCLLTWANGQLLNNDLSESDRLHKIGMVRGYFEKYHNVLQGELDQVLNAPRVS